MYTYLASDRFLKTHVKESPGLEKKCFVLSYSKSIQFRLS